MMTQHQHNLLKLIEECLEAAHRAAKAMQFGLAEAQPGQQFTNEDRLVLEIVDVQTAIVRLQDSGQIRYPSNVYRLIEEKKVKIEKYLDLSISLGQVEPDRVSPDLIESMMDRTGDPLDQVALSHAQGHADQLRRAGATMDDVVDQAIRLYHKKCNPCVSRPGAKTVDRADPTLVQQPLGTPASMVGAALLDLQSHRNAWRDAMVKAMEAEQEGGDPAAALYWDHEIKALDRAIAVLTGTSPG